MIDKNKYTNTGTGVITTTGIGGFANGQLCRGYVAYPKPPPTNKLQNKKLFVGGVGYIIFAQTIGIGKSPNSQLIPIPFIQTNLFFKKKDTQIIMSNRYDSQRCAIQVGIRASLSHSVQLKCFDSGRSSEQQDRRT